MMAVLDESPRPTYAPRLQRRHEIVTTGGMAGALCVGDALRECGYPVRDFAVDVRDGVPYGSISCTIAVTDAESALFTERIGALPAVIAIDSY
jgi:hypothetical protein